MHQLDDMVKEFLVESYENLDQLDRDLVTLEQEPDSQPILASIFRTIHTIKGTCGFLGFGKLERVAHVGENLLSKLRDGELALAPDITSGLLAQVDAIREMLGNIEQLGSEGQGDYAGLIGQLTALQEVEHQPQVVPQQVKAEENEPPTALLGDLLIHSQRATPSQVAEALEAQIQGDRRLIGEILVDQFDVRPEHVQEAVRTQNEARLAEGSIRVDVGLLDKLMNRVGELVLARNQILQFTNSLEDATFLGTCQRLNLITTELQEGVMKTRMQPIDTIWNKFPRVVRDLALQCGKQVRIEMEGKDTELDKTIVEAIKDPLTHLVRNSVDHGIEPPQARLAAGKPAEGRLLLRAYHEGGQVNIEITDDGGGLKLERIKAKALERGLLTQEQASRMNDRELAQLIFRPGFSTAEKVTNVSGRGVGMDVVKTNIERIGGTIDVQSQPGRSTTIRIKIPLTLAIIPALIVSVGGARYAIPQVSLLELVRLEGPQARRGIEQLHRAPVYRLRGRLLPLVYLRQQLDALEGAQQTNEEDSVVNIVVLRADDRQFGLVVDAINDTEEIVVKPLGKQFKNVSVFAGATIMGDGAVALILDVMGLAQNAHVVSEARDHALSELTEEAQRNADDTQTLLVASIGDKRLALPISAVARLEEIDAGSIEHSEQQPVVQYRGQMLPLIQVADLLGVISSPDPDRPMQVVVCTQQGASAGLVVDRIVDIVHGGEALQRRGRMEGVVGSAVIQGRVTDVIDPAALLRRACVDCGELVGSA